MSKLVAGQSNEIEDVVKYIHHISNSTYVKRIFIVGSRSPLSKKTARPDSDWDIMVEKDPEDGYLPRPRTWAIPVALDIFSMQDREDAVEIWPTDEQGVLS